MGDIPVISPETPADAPIVEALIDRAFGPGRHAKAAERLREGRDPVRELSVVARAGGAVIGCARFYPITIGQAPALLLGPFAVEESHRGHGLGASLIRDACAAAHGAGHALILLVGDEAFFASLGFSGKPARRVTMPGPVDQRRVLVRALKVGAADDLSGAVAAAGAQSGDNA